MKNRMTQREMCARYLAKHPNQWIAGYELVKNASSIIGKDYLIQDADTRAYELTREGFCSSINEYKFDHKKDGKYAYFRCYSKKSREYVMGLKDWSFAV